LTHIIKQLEGAVKRTHPKPLNSRERRESLHREERGSFGDEICTREKESAGEKPKNSTAAAIFSASRARRGRREEKKLPSQTSRARIIWAVRGVTERSLCGTGHVR